MKRTIKIFGIAAIYTIGLLVISSCGNSEDVKHHDESTEHHEHADEHHHEHEHAAYICPMECEGDNTYHEPGNCPECGMEMVKVEEMEKQHHGEHHEEGEHHGEHSDEDHHEHNH